MQYITKMIRSRLASLFVAEEQGKIVGYIHGSLRPMPPIFQVSTFGRLNSAYVLKHYRRQGVGRRLTDALLQWFQTKQIEYVEVNSDIRNSLGIDAWKKYGFQQAMIKFRLKLPTQS